MIEADKRKAIFLMHQEGMNLREIARRLGVSRNTVRAIAEQKGAMPNSVRRDKIRIDSDLLRRLYEECEGYVQRMHEKLVEEEGIRTTYSTLSRMLRAIGIGKSEKVRCDQAPDEPGAEMQHDTSVYQVKLADKKVKVIASILYLRYSKKRYLKFYRAFNRFKMKCFFHEALKFWGYAAPQCIIDNTNLARLRGTGANAVMVPEMKFFAKQYGFHFRCHEIGHANRKAGEERSFYTVETNFLPGRIFQNLEDLNAQGFEWATVRMEKRPQTKTKLIPAEVFEHERARLIKLPAHLPAPYLVHERATDQYGYISFGGNYYWIPGTKRDDVRALEYDDQLKIYHERKLLVEYRLAGDGVRNEKFSPEGFPKPRYHPNNRKKPTVEEEKRLRAMAEAVSAYLDFALKPKGIERHRFVRQLFALTRQMSSTLFIKTVERGLHYRITSVETLRRIAILYMNQSDEAMPGVEVDESFRERDNYLDGHLTEAPDFAVYDKILEEDDDE